MLHLHLQEQIMHFVSSFRVVREEQIHRFFREASHELVRGVINQLVHEGKLFRQDEDKVSTVKHLHTTLNRYDPTIDALEAMLLLPADSIDWFLPMSYPVDICFGTIANLVYDVTTFGLNWQVKYGLTLSARHKMVPPGEEDCMIHVAVVRDEDLIEKLLPLEFQLYVVIQPDGRVVAYSPPDE